MTEDLEFFALPTFSWKKQIATFLKNSHDRERERENKWLGFRAAEGEGGKEHSLRSQLLSLQIQPQRVRPKGRRGSFRRFKSI